MRQQRQSPIFALYAFFRGRGLLDQAVNNKQPKEVFAAAS
jgi:hypothetical protein